MKRFSVFVLFGGAALLFSGCATIMGKGDAEILNLTSNPSKAGVEIIDVNSGTTISEGQTPHNVALEKKQGFFKGKTYAVKVKKEGFKEVNFNIKPSINGWYLGGNLVFGGLIGWLIVDPATGAMWNLKPEKQSGISTNESIISIKLVSDLSDEQKAKMERIK